MDVDQCSFYPLLPDILADIAEAHFVAIDLELSGVPSKQVHNDSGKPSLQERYSETKEAAERYQILQFGMTCVTQDVDQGLYILKPYNFDLSPTILEKHLDVERIFSFQSGACEFLLRNGFDFGKTFHRGVPYLSFAESKEARERFSKRLDKSAMSDIQIKPTETESLAFLEYVRSRIDAWLQTPKLGFVNIGPLGSNFHDDGTPMDELSRFEKRLVHQLIRAEYPDIVALSRPRYIQIIHLDPVREQKIQQGRKRELEQKILRQKGFRWVIEALLGKSLGGLDLRECAKNPRTGADAFVNLDALRSRVIRARSRLKDNPRIVVGHNCFLDFIYVYRTFIGQLPDTVEEFQAKLNALWPMVIDTKYVSTHNCGDISPISSLKEVAHQLSDQKTPRTVTDAEYGKYDKVEAAHEAGYDSYLTAQIAIRLSAKLEQEGSYVDTPEQPTTTLTKSPADLHVAGEPFEDEDKFVPADNLVDWTVYGDPTVVGVRTEPLVQHERSVHPDFKAAHKLIPDGMPRFGSDFWRVYGNKLRVFGTEESVCVLDEGNPVSTDLPSLDPEDDEGGVSVPDA